jgi:hypothetical protein
MPLCAAIYDADTIEARPVRWGFWHLQVLTLAARAHEPATEGMPLLEVWSYPSLSAGTRHRVPDGVQGPR